MKAAQYRRSTLIRFWVLLVIVTAVAGSVGAQHGKARLTGQVISAHDKAVLPGATVLLRMREDSTLVASTTSDSEGRFELGPVARKDYVLQITMVGFLTARKMLTPVASTDIGFIVLMANEKLLKTIEVTGDRVLIETRPGMITYNVAADAMAFGKTLIDIASGLPGISQNGSGALTYGGDNQVTVLVNGRKSNINPVDVMNQIQPTNVERLELITDADPRFATSTGAATINIVLKKNKDKGVNGSVALSLNNYGFVNGSVNINGFSGRTNLYVTFSNDDRWLRMQTEYGRKNKEADTSLFTGKIDNTLHHSLKTLTTGADFYPDSTNVVTLEHSVSFHGDDMDAVNSRTLEGATTTSRVRSFPCEWENMLSVNHQHKFRRPGQWVETELSGTLFTLRNEKTFGDDESAEHLNVVSRALRLRSELTQPVSGRSTLGVGIDFAFIDVQNTSWFSRLERKMTDGEELVYDNQKYAAYTAYTLKLSDAFSIRPGIRLENTRTRAAGGNLPRIVFDLVTFYPALNLLWDPPSKTSITLDYIRKIQYPNLYTLYTLPNQADTFNLQKGNGALVPAIRNEGAMSIRYTTSAFNLNTRLYIHHIRHAILSYTTVDEADRMITTSENVGSLVGYGGSLSFSVSKMPVWKLNNGASFGFSELVPNKEAYLASKRMYSISAFVTNQFRFTKKLSTEVSLRMMNFARHISERYNPMYNLSCQFSYTTNKAWVFSVVANDMLATMVNRGLIQPHESLRHTMTFRHRSRFIQASIRFKFGKTARTRTRSLENEKVQFSNG